MKYVKLALYALALLMAVIGLSYAMQAWTLNFGSDAPMSEEQFARLGQYRLIHYLALPAAIALISVGLLLPRRLKPQDELSSEDTADDT